MKKLNYIELKTGARDKRSKRLAWLDAKTVEYAAEKESILLELQRDTKAIDELEALEGSYTDLEARITRLSEMVTEFTGEEAQEALRSLEEAKTLLDETHEKMRAVYYDR